MARLAARRKLLAGASLGIVLFGCGQSERHGEQEGRDAGEDGDAEPPPPTNCAYPRAGQADAEFMEKIARLAQPGCRYQFGEPRELPFDATESNKYGEYAFSFDVNGDGIGDIFFWRSTGDLTLAVSSVSDGQIVYAQLNCDALAAIPPHRRVFVRDISSDGVPDLVVGGNGPALGGAVDVEAFLNHPSGFVEVLQHRWTEATGSVLIDVAVDDLGGAAADLNDLAFGYDWARDAQSAEAEWGVAIAQVDSVSPEPIYRLRNWATDWPQDNGDLKPSGEFALGHDAAGTWLFIARFSPPPLQGLVVRRQGDELSELMVELEQPPPPVVGDAFAVDAWAVPLAGRGDVLALLFYSAASRDLGALALYDLSDPTTGPLPILQSFATVEVNDFNREFGGGGTSNLRWMIDVNGDGDVDFSERGIRSAGGLEPGVLDDLTVRPSLGGAGFGEPLTINVSPFMNASAESPFVAAGAASAAIVVNDYQSLGESGPTGPPTFQVLECAPE